MRHRLATLPLAGAFLAGAATAALAAPPGWAPLLEPAALASMLGDGDTDIRVIHVTGDFAAGHIPGAAHAPYAEWRGPPQNPGAIRPAEEFGDLLRSLGIDAQTPVAVVHEGATTTDMGAAARVYWTLKSLGVGDLALVNGGFAAWQDAGLPVSTTPAEIAQSDYDPEWSNAWRVTTEEVEDRVADGTADLIDARPQGFFEGRLWSIARGGTIQGAGNLSHEVWFDGTRMRPAHEVAQIASEHGSQASLTVSFCNTGHWAATNWFALSEVAGRPDTRLYAESMAEWADAGRPLDNAPGRLSVYVTQTRNWIAGIFG